MKHLSNVLLDNPLRPLHCTYCHLVTRVVYFTSNPAVLPAELSFDLSPLTKASGGFYNLTTSGYDYLINVCGPVKASSCPDKAGACQLEKAGGTAAQ